MKLKPAPIVVADLNEYLATDSDFAFELGIVRRIAQMGLGPSHGGTYVDPHSNKTREFDIRVTIRPDRAPPYLAWSVAVHLAIECKHIRPNYPLLIECAPRAQNEAFHQIMMEWGQRPEATSCASNTPYRLGEPVGKSLAQIGRSLSSDLTSSSKDTYDKWSQALTSLNQLASSGAARGMAMAMLLPVVVVPDERLWAVHYDASGSVTAGPHQVDRISYYVDEDYSWRSHGETISYKVTHLEFVTVQGLSNLLNQLRAHTGLEQYFHELEVDRILQIRGVSW